MANSDASFGLRPVMHKGGAPYNGAANFYYVGSSDSTALFIGDPVIITGRASDEEISGNPPGSVPGVVKAAAGVGEGFSGVIVGVEAVNAESVAHRAASTQRGLYVADDPDLLYEIQANGTVTGAMIGSNAELIFTNAGSTSYNRSGVELDVGAITQATAGQLLIHRLVPKSEDADIDTANPIVLVSINTHLHHGNSTGIA